MKNKWGLWFILAYIFITFIAYISKSEVFFYLFAPWNGIFYLFGDAYLKPLFNIIGYGKMSTNSLAFILNSIILYYLGNALFKFFGNYNKAQTEAQDDNTTNSLNKKP